MSSTICAKPAIRSSSTGSRRILNFVSRASAIWSSATLQIELRTALEPWHVLGEEPGGGGTVRYVDSSLERLQVKAQRPRRRPLRHHRSTAIACRCIRPARTAKASPACATARGSRRFVCSRPSASHAPLRFDLYDTWNQRSLGGCTYHVAHPGGRGYDTFPVNSYEAESRRLSDFSGTATSRASSRRRRKFRTATFRSRSICAMSDDDWQKSRFAIKLDCTDERNVRRTSRNSRSAAGQKPARGAAV